MLKIAAGFAYARFYLLPQYYEGSDTWRFYRLSLEETTWLKHDPLAFIKDLFVHGYGKAGNLFSGENSYWNDLKSNVPVKLLAVFNIFTFNSYYTSIILFNFLFLFGLVALFRLFNELSPNKKLLIIAGIFLLPSTLFWCSGIHKDGLILSATGLIIYMFYHGIQYKFTTGKWLLMLFCMLLIFSLRNYVALALVPALFCLWLCYKFRKGVSVFLVAYASALVLFFITPLVFPGLNFPAFVSEKQHEFLLLKGTSEVKVQPLEPTFRSFISILPSALDMAFLRPHFSEVKNFSYIPAALENVLLLVLIVLSLFFIRRKTFVPVILFMLFFSLSILLLCGYTIPFSGAIVRYRSFVLPLLITSLLCMSNFSLKLSRPS